MPKQIKPIALPIKAVQVTPAQPVKAIAPALTRSEVMQAVVAKLGKDKAGLLMWLDDLPATQTLSTGLAHLNSLLKGGIPVGGITCIVGLDQSGKTSLALSIAGQSESVLYIDADRKVSLERAQLFGGHGDYIIAQPGCFEEAFELAKHFILAGTKLVVIDSLPSLPSRKELEEKDFDKITGMAPLAGFFARKLGVMNDLCHSHNASLVIVNQLRDIINAMPFGKKYHEPGGRMLASLTDTKVFVANKGKLKDSKKNVVGIEIAYLVEKSAHVPSQQGGEISLPFTRGFVPSSELKDIERELYAEVVSIQEVEEAMADPDEVGE